MIKVFIDGMDGHLVVGMQSFAREYDFQLVQDSSVADLSIKLDKTEEKILEVNRNGKSVKINYCFDAHIFRAIGLVLQNISDTDYSSCETVFFDEVCVMLDVTQGSQLPKPENVCKVLLRFAAMGITAFMLYMEDSYEISDEPYFGYMRSKYTFDELKSIDDCAYSLGIEAIPCMQTLGHLSQILRWKVYAPVKDTASTLLVGEEKTYELIRKMLENASKPFRTKRIHIGMDEAWGLGLGNYLNKNGYVDKTEVFSRHMKRVMEITAGLGLKPMMWGDMFFRAVLGETNYYTDKELHFSKEFTSSIPENLGIVYWDYHDHGDVTRNMLSQLKKFNREIIFAGAVRNNRGFACKHDINTRTASCTLPICKEQGIRKVMATAWGDNCPDGSIFSALLGFQLYAEHAFSKEVSEEKWYNRFKFCAKCEPKAFEDLRYFDEVCGIVEEDTIVHYNAAKYLLWQDPMLGMFDANIKELELEEHYDRLAKDLSRYAAENCEYTKFFNFYAAAARTLSKKSRFGVRLHDAYKSGTGLEEIKTDIAELTESVKELWDIHRDIWFAICKPIGWEVMDMRYGCLLGRLRTTACRIEDYLAGNIKSIPELEQPQLPYNGEEGLPQELEYLKIATASNVHYF